MASRQRYGTRRSSQTLPVRAVITVVCDDTTTAVGYFELLRHEFRDQKTIRVYPAPRCGALGNDVIQHAIEKKPVPVESGDRTVVLVDVDTNPNQQTLAKSGMDKDVEVLFSKPCFEVWTLAHLEDTGQAFQDCSAVIHRIKIKWKAQFDQDFGRKSQAEYSKIIPYRQVAIDRCRKRNAQNSQSWSEVWKVVDIIIEG
jgi:hypothetical protein